MSGFMSYSGSTYGSRELASEEKSTNNPGPSRSRVVISVQESITHGRDAIFHPDFLIRTGYKAGDLVHITTNNALSDVKDFESRSGGHDDQIRALRDSYLTIVQPMHEREVERNKACELVVSKLTSSKFGLISNKVATVSLSDASRCTASHIEITFRDAYMSRSDMWRFSAKEMVGRCLHVGQRLTFMGSLKAAVKSIHVRGKRVRTAYFSNRTVPVFRSEAARYIIYIQMSSEMWDFDSEGQGEIMFDRVVEGFLPELFGRWADAEVHHLVSIVMFGRMEYGEQMPSSLHNLTLAARTGNLANYKDFYRVVVTDMASAQWSIILRELKRNFRVFLRDVLLFQPTPDAKDGGKAMIAGRLSKALKGNILEAINIAASQFANDYIDRDLIRTGVSTVVVTAGSGVFDVDRDLLTSTSGSLTNNGIGIDVVCLSKMPLHSVPLFRYKTDSSSAQNELESANVASSPASLHEVLSASLSEISSSPAFSTPEISSNYFSRFPNAFPARLPHSYGYGIPHWIDLSYWSANSHKPLSDPSTAGILATALCPQPEPFVPRLRMYEPQMVGLMESGMADISIPFLHQYSLGNRFHTKLASPTNQISFSRSMELGHKSPAAIRHREAAFQTRKSPQKLVENQSTMMNHYDKTLFAAAIPTSKSLSFKKSPGFNGTTPLDIKKPGAKAVPVSNVSDGSRAKRSEQNFQKVGDSFNKSQAVVMNTGVARPVSAARNISYTVKGIIPTKALPTIAMFAPGSTADPSSMLGIEDKAGRIVKDHSSSVRKTTLVTHSNPAIDQRLSLLTSALQAAAKNYAGTLTGKEQGTEHSEDEHHTVATSPPDVSIKTIKCGEVNSSTNKNLSSEASSAESFISSSIPFLHNVNPSNPTKKQLHATALGRWQHLVPKEPRAAEVKWHSLCTPASVPLTTEDFPVRESLNEDYTRISHIVNIPVTSTSVSQFAHAHNLLLEMLSLRVAHGYQFVVGSNVEAVCAGDQLRDSYSVFNPPATESKNVTVVLTMGICIQKLVIQDAKTILVTKFTRKDERRQLADTLNIEYNPYIRTILGEDFFSRSLSFKGFEEDYPWQQADQHIAHEKVQEEQTVKELRYWRARFVLIPTNPSDSTLAMYQTDETEEEIHLLGIRELTKLWQRNRYIALNERINAKTRPRGDADKDPDPLEIKLETLNASELVSSELDKLINLENKVGDHSVQLLPESQKLDKESSVAKFAQLMRGDKGIEIKNRRWHLRLHINCFHGEEFTSWLLQNVNGLSTRAQAVELGNALMHEGLFEHVSGKIRPFKDGNYFYTIKHPVSNQRPEPLTPWFGAKHSNHASPAISALEIVNKDVPSLSLLTHSASGTLKQIRSHAGPIQAENKRKKVSLSRMIRINVDPHNRVDADRPEVVDLHYDRFHNPENCYHLELNWLTTTCKLVDDALISWTNTAEKYGLKLVQVPISEACEILKTEPFRNPYIVKLVVEPPASRLGTTVFDTTIFSASPGSSPSVNSGIQLHFYQKLLLKRFNFVLDIEAVSEYPEGVDISYSWGKLNYKYTQFVHRSGVILAQITNDGDILLLANRLYNSRMSLDSRKLNSEKANGSSAVNNSATGASTLSMQASGIIGINLVSPSYPTIHSPRNGHQASPMIRAAAVLRSSQRLEDYKSVIADSFGINSRHNTQKDNLITPEQIKNDLEGFCNDRVKLEQFYRETTLSVMTRTSIGERGGRRAADSNSAVMTPVREVTGIASDITGIPSFELPEPASATRELRRATVNYENVSGMFEVRARHDSSGG